MVDPCHLEEIMQLSIGQLREKIGQELATGFADLRIAERAGVRLTQMPDARRGILPDRRLRPLIEVHAADARPVEGVGLSERQPHIVQHHERFVAPAVARPSLRQAQETLLLHLRIGMLHEDGKEL
jgi:hypothetical protein